tara:strand:+ start:138 stop:467 length:330 start_codon:yes stop_codon:yes gene_type:complete
MTELKFEEIVDETLNQIRETLLIKGKEYRRDGNPFHNFDSGAQKSNSIREKVLDGFLLKHEVSISDMTDDLSLGILPKLETINEKFGDNILYLIIKKASFIERISLEKE